MTASVVYPRLARSRWNLLGPFEVDHRHHADLEVGQRGDVHVAVGDRAVQPFVEEQVRARLELGPIGELAGGNPVGGGIRLVVDIVPVPPASA